MPEFDSNLPAAEKSFEGNDPPSGRDLSVDLHRCRVLIGVCTLNEAANIKSLIAGLRSAIPTADVLVVDDHSPDNTAAVVSEIAQTDSCVRVLVRETERGLGGAIRRAMSVAMEEDYDYFLNLDGDWSHDPDQLMSLLHATISQNVDVVIGSRYVPGGSIVGWPIYRRLMSRLVNRFATGCLRLPVNDCSGSMRCYRVSTLKALGLQNLQSDGYAILEELLVRLQRQGASMAEVPVTFTDRKLGKSKLTLGEAARSIVQLFRMLGR